MRNLYQEQLQNLNQELIQMGAACKEIIDLAAKALTDYSPELEEKTRNMTRCALWIWGRMTISPSPLA